MVKLFRSEINKRVLIQKAIAAYSCEINLKIIEFLLDEHNLDEILESP